MKTKSLRRPWTRAEKSLLLAPLLIALASGAVWLRNWAMPVVIEVQGASDFRSLEFSPDGKRLVVFFNDSKAHLNLGRVYDLKTRSSICDLKLPVPRGMATNPMSGIGTRGKPYFQWPSWSSDGTRIVAGYDDGARGTTKIPYIDPTRPKSKPSFYFNQIGKMALWNAQSGALDGDWLYAPATEDSYGNVRFSRDGKTLIGYGRPPAIFDAATGQRLQVLRGSFQRAANAHFNEKLGLLAVESEHYTKFQVFDSKSKRVVWQPFTGMVDNFQWSGDVLGVEDWSNLRAGQRSEGGNRLLLWNGKTRLPLPSPPFTNASSMSFNSDKRTLAFLNWNFRPSSAKLGKSDGEVVVWNYQLHRVMWRYHSTSIIRWIQWSPDGHWLSMVVDSASGSSEQLLVFDRSGKLKVKREVATFVTRWSPDSTRLAVVSRSTGSSGRIEVVRVED